jgi:hypothetical protein
VLEPHLEWHMGCCGFAAAGFLLWGRGQSVCTFIDFRQEILVFGMLPEKIGTGRTESC